MITTLEKTECDLRRAWPKGYLAMRGVSTVGGWHCVHADGSLSSWSDGHWGRKNLKRIRIDEDIRGGVFAGREEEEQARKGRLLVDAGDLLPNVDHLDVATWACLKVDLANAIDVWKVGGHFGDRFTKVVSFGWSRWDEDGGLWALYAIMPSDQDEGMAYTFEIDTPDPELALVTARIQLREESQ